MAQRTSTRKFRAETQKLLDLMIHSVYAQREVFLRELISNASDAIDKARFRALTDDRLASDEAWEIRLIPDADAGTLTIIDNGIGMSHDEVVDQIGTIARSGSEAFSAQVQSDASQDQAAAAEGEGPSADSSGSPQDPELIGRFGVGFYSAFMAADRVELRTFKPGEEHAVLWSSTGGESYTIRKEDPPSPGNEATPAHGTSITLHLKPWARGIESENGASERSASAAFGEETSTGSPPMDFTDPEILRQVVKRHSDYVAFPVVVQRPGEGDLAERSETVNSMQPPWARPKDAISDEEHADFYRHLAHDWEAPLTHVHVRAEGMHEYRALLYVPARAPVDLFMRDARRGLQLFARRVMIMEECQALMPEYLRFVRGVVESPDVPLSLSRETVQQDRLIGAIRRHLVRRVLDELARLRDEDREKYEAFWSEFGPALKEGFHVDPARHDTLRGLLLARSTEAEGWTTLDEYITRMRAGQEDIWWLAGDQVERLRNAPQLEAFRAKGVEVLLLSDPADEIVMNLLGEHEGHRLRSAAHDELDLSAIGPRPPSKAEGEDASGEDGAEKTETAEDEPAPSSEALAPFLAQLAGALEGEVGTVRSSARLTESAACLVAVEGAVSPQLEQLMRAMGQPLPEQERVLEVNARHPLLRAMLRRYLVNAADPRLEDFANMLYDQALLAEGRSPRDPAAFARRVAAVMAESLDRD